MTYNDANYAGHGCMEDVDGGLTKWGRRPAFFWEFEGPRLGGESGETPYSLGA